MAEVARRFACSASTVRRRLRAWSIPTRTQGPKTSHHGVHGAAGGLAWSAEVAWIVGLMASDGNLARTGHALSLTSNDVELLESVRSILRIGNRLGHVRGGLGHACHRLQWRDRELYGWLSDIGLTPRKSLTLGPLTVPDEYFADFFRGCIDGDGTILVYTDRHHATRNATYVYERLYLSIVSAAARSSSGCRRPSPGSPGHAAPSTTERGGTAARCGLFGTPNVNRCDCCRGCTHRPGRRACGASGPRPSSSCPGLNKGMLWGACRCVGTGRRSGLKIRCPQGRRGSTPLTGTIP